jgi:hypothetical protein
MFVCSSYMKKMFKELYCLLILCPRRTGQAQWRAFSSRFPLGVKLNQKTALPFVGLTEIPALGKAVRPPTSVSSNYLYISQEKYGNQTLNIATGPSYGLSISTSSSSRRLSIASTLRRMGSLSRTAETLDRIQDTPSHRFSIAWTLHRRKNRIELAFYSIYRENRSPFNYVKIQPRYNYHRLT